MARTSKPIAGHVRNLNWKRQPVDERDHQLHHYMKMALHLPKKATTQSIADPPIRDQGSLGSCTQNAGTSAMGFLYMLQTKKPDPIFSRLYGYYYTRVSEGTDPTDDSGCNVRDVFKTYNKYGICLEKTWPYDLSKFATEPDDSSKQEAQNHKAILFLGLPDLNSIKQCIDSGFPFIFGFDCYESLESEEVSQTGVIPLPAKGEKSIGGHALYGDTYDDDAQMISGNNSWSEDWGDKGRFHLPYSYFQKGLATDAMSVRVETGAV